jgi:hypothetical protein
MHAPPPMAEDDLTLNPTHDRRRLQRLTMQRGDKEKDQTGQLRQSKTRTEPTPDQPTNNVGNAPHDYTLPQPLQPRERQTQRG